MASRGALGSWCREPILDARPAMEKTWCSIKFMTGVQEAQPALKGRENHVTGR